MNRLVFNVDNQTFEIVQNPYNGDVNRASIYLRSKARKKRIGTLTRQGYLNVPKRFQTAIEQRRQFIKDYIGEVFSTSPAIKVQFCKTWVK